jgi:hypothetical protein
MAHAQCMLDNLGYIHALRICNTHCFSTATILEQSASMLRKMYIACLVLLIYEITMPRPKDSQALPIISVLKDVEEF